MLNYFMRSADGKRMYRIEYDMVAEDGKPTTFNVGTCHVTGSGVRLPSGLTVDGVDVFVDLCEVVVDIVTGAVQVSNAAAYRTLAKAVYAADVDRMWADA